MAKLSERLKEAIRNEMDPVSLVDLLEECLPVCAAVEAFQAAHREYDAACDLIDDEDRATRERATAASDAIRSVEARLLEVNLG
jgi:hypothetical protein